MTRRLRDGGGAPLWAGPASVTGPGTAPVGAPGSGTGTQVPPASPSTCSAGPRPYRGTLTAAASGQAARPLYVVNTVGLDDYVRGVVAAEMPASWPAEALKAQAVAARSYGTLPCPQARTHPATDLYDVVDTVACQVYGGVAAERPTTDAAVAATAGKVVTVGGKVLRTEFSSSNGGWIAAAGGAVAREDPWDAVGAQAAGSTVHRWTGTVVPLSRLESAFGTGPLRDVRVLARDGRGEWGGRVLRVRLVGDARTLEVTGEQVRTAAGLRSSWFALRPVPVPIALTPSSPLAAKQAALGGAAGWLGPALTPELTTPDGVGRYLHHRSGSLYWHPSTGAQSVRGSIRETWARHRWEAGLLGYPLTDELVTADGVGRRSEFQRGSVYWSPRTGAHEVHGSIRLEWLRRGGERTLGYPTSDEHAVPGGRASDFERARLVFSAATGTVTVTPR